MEDSFPLGECVLVWQTLLHVVPCLAAWVIEMIMHWEIDSNICRDTSICIGCSWKYCTILHTFMHTYNSVINAFDMIECICCYMYVPTCTCGIYTVGKLSSVLTNKLLSTIWTRHVLSVQSQMGVNSVNAFLVPDITTWHDLICILVIGLYMYIIHWILFNK